MRIVSCSVICMVDMEVEIHPCKIMNIFTKVSTLIFTTLSRMKLSWLVKHAKVIVINVPVVRKYILRQLINHYDIHTMLQEKLSPFPTQTRYYSVMVMIYIILHVYTQGVMVFPCSTLPRRHCSSSSSTWALFTL